MGRFKAGSQKERKLNWGKVIFSSAYTVIVETPTMTVVFHRYGAPSGYYRIWEDFRKEMKRANLQSIFDVYKYANRFGVTSYIKETRLPTRGDGRIKSKKEHD